MEDVLTELYEVVTQRHENPQEGSYTCYLFDQGLDKILKKGRRRVRRDYNCRQKRHKGGYRRRDFRPALPPCCYDEKRGNHTRRRKGGAVKASSKIREPQKISSGG